MRLEGKIWKQGRHWLVEVPLLDLMTQGRSKRDAMSMLEDAVDSLVNRPSFHAEVIPCKGDRVELASNADSLLVALLLRRQREARGLSLADVARRLKQTSRNAYARYKQGKSVPTIDKLRELLEVVDPNRDVVLHESVRHP